jgi:hypothetical protein
MAQCFRVLPYSFEEELFIDVQQIIPTPEAEEFMIGMSSKDTEEKTAQVTQKGRHRLRLEFWNDALDTLRTNGVDLFQNINPSRDHWLSAGSGVRSCPYNLIFSRDEARVELSLQRSDREENKNIFDQLFSKKEEIESKFGSQLTWKRMDDKKSSRIQFAQPFDGFNRENWPEMIDWLAKHMAQFEKALSNPLNAANPSTSNV